MSEWVRADASPEEIAATRARAPTPPEPRRFTDADWPRLVDDLQAEAARNARREAYLIGMMLRGGGEGTLLGMPIRLTVEWPEGLPQGATAASLATMAENMPAEEPR
jgi:hypothetical protein